MSGISHRKIYVDVDRRHTGERGLIRFLEWAHVRTDLGSMAEPHTLGNIAHSTPLREYDPTDMIARIDGIRHVDKGDITTIFGENVHGGTLMPLNGR